MSRSEVDIRREWLQRAIEQLRRDRFILDDEGFHDIVTVIDGAIAQVEEKLKCLGLEQHKS